MVQHTYLPNFLFIFLNFLAALCLHSWVQAFSSWGNPELSLIVAHGLLTAVASLVVNTGSGFPGGSVVKNPPAMQETQEMQVQSLGWEDPLEKEMAHSSILAWEIPWTEEPGRLQSMASQKCWTQLTSKVTKAGSFIIIRQKINLREIDRTKKLTSKTR